MTRIGTLNRHGSPLAVASGGHKDHSLAGVGWARDRFNAPRRFAHDAHPPGLWERPATRACHSRPQ
jgi:hypothetical protein